MAGSWGGLRARGKGYRRRTAASSPEAESERRAEEVWWRRARGCRGWAAGREESRSGEGRKDWRRDGAGGGGRTAGSNPGKFRLGVGTRTQVESNACGGPPPTPPDNTQREESRNGETGTRIAAFERFEDRPSRLEGLAPYTAQVCRAQGSTQGMSNTKRGCGSELHRKSRSRRRGR